MLVRLTPDQTARMWTVIERPIESSLPPTAGKQVDRMKNILVSLLAGGMELWLSYRQQKDKSVKITGVVITTIVVDPLSQTKDLLIYSIYGIHGMLRSEWENGYEALVKWAKSNGCERITAFTDVESIIAKVKALGGTADQTYVILPITDYE